MKTAIITGITGMDASLLADLLISKEYKVIGIKRPTSTNENISHLLHNPNFVTVDSNVTNFISISIIVQRYQPTEFYNLAALTSVGLCAQEPLKCFQVNCEGVLNCLESIRLFSPHTKFFAASSSFVYGKSFQEKQCEYTPVAPSTAYGCSKLCAELLVKLYREKYGLFGCYARLFNHIHPRQSPDFVVKKICNYVFMLDCLKKIGSTYQKLKIGDLDAKIDVSCASDVVEAIHLMLQQQQPIDFCIGSGKLSSIEEIIRLAFSKIYINNYLDYLEIDPTLYRSSDSLCADTTLIEQTIGWKAEKSLDEIIGKMVQKTF